MHFDFYDVFYSLHSQQRVSAAIAVVFTVTLLSQEYKFTNVVSFVIITP